MKLIVPIFILLFTLPICLPVSAGLMGLVPGRSAYVAAQPNLSVELGASWYTNQLQWSATRINFKPSQRVVTYLDLSVVRAVDVPTANAREAEFLGLGYGGGIIFTVPDFLDAYDVAFNASYHNSNIDEFDFDASSLGAGAVAQTLQQSQWSAAFMISPIDPLYENGTSWYSSLGFVSTEAGIKADDSALGQGSSTDFEQINGVAFGMGIFKPYSKGRFYAGYEWLAGDHLLGAGISYSLR